MILVRVLDSCVLGPVSMGVTEVCQVLGVNTEMAAGAKRRRQDLVEEGALERERERGALRRQESQGRGGRHRVGTGSGQPRSSLQRQFDLFARRVGAIQYFVL